MEKPKLRFRPFIILYFKDLGVWKQIINFPGIHQAKGYEPQKCVVCITYIIHYSKDLGVQLQIIDFTGIHLAKKCINHWNVMFVNSYI